MVQEYQILATINKRKSAPQTLFAKRTLVNGPAFIDWAKRVGFKTTQDPKDLHVTLAYSKAPLAWPSPQGGELTVPATAEGRSVVPLGDQGAVVLKFNSPELAARWQELKDAGASWDYAGYQPHVTVSWKADGLDTSKIKPYDGELVFGPEVFKPVNPDGFTPKVEKLGVEIPFVKIGGDDQRMAWGWASVHVKDGETVVDLQKDAIEPEELVRATTEFMEDVRKAQEMHNSSGEQVGTVVHSFPLTFELAKAFGIKCDQEGWMVGVKVHSNKVWKRIKNRELVAFSIGGSGERVPM